MFESQLPDHYQRLRYDITLLYQPQIRASVGDAIVKHHTTDGYGLVTAVNIDLNQCTVDFGHDKIKTLPLWWTHEGHRDPDTLQAFSFMQKLTEEQYQEQLITF